MNLQEYISSGILESYVLGIASPEESVEVEALASKHPEIEAELNTIRNSIESLALSYEKEPPAYLREKILGSISELDTTFSKKKDINLPTEPKIVPFTPEIQKTVWLKPWMVAASYTLLALSIAANFFLFNNLKNTQDQLAKAESKSLEIAQTLQTSQKDYEDMKVDINMLQNPETQGVMLSGLQVAPKSWAKIYWNKEKKMVLMASHDLPNPPDGMQYQLWAIMDGKPIDAGVFNMSNDLQLLKKIEGAQAFAITLEKKGGKPQPEGEMYVMGKISS